MRMSVRARLHACRFVQREVADADDAGEQERDRQRAIAAPSASAILAGWRGGACTGPPIAHYLRDLLAVAGPYSDSNQPMRSWPYRFQIGFLPPLKLV